MDCSWWFDTKYHTQLGVVPCMHVWVSSKMGMLDQRALLVNGNRRKRSHPGIDFPGVTNNVISMIPQVFSTTVHWPSPKHTKTIQSWTTLSDHPGTSFQSSRRAVVVAMAPFALAAFSSDGKRQAIQPVSEVCWMKRPTSCCLIETSAPEQMRNHSPVVLLSL